MSSGSIVAVGLIAAVLLLFIADYIIMFGVLYHRCPSFRLNGITYTYSQYTTNSCATGALLYLLRAAIKLPYFQPSLLQLLWIYSFR